MVVKCYRCKNVVPGQWAFRVCSNNDEGIYLGVQGHFANGITDWVYVYCHACYDHFKSDLDSWHKITEHVNTDLRNQINTLKDLNSSKDT
jgi:hypothetical protein